jgi:hypothetical protein
MTQNLEETIAKTNPPEDRAEVLRQFNDINIGRPQGLVDAMTGMICRGEIVIYLDQKRALKVKAPHLLN